MHVLMWSACILDGMPHCLLDLLHSAHRGPPVPQTFVEPKEKQIPRVRRIVRATTAARRRRHASADLLGSPGRGASSHCRPDLVWAPAGLQPAAPHAAARRGRPRTLREGQRPGVPPTPSCGGAGLERGDGIVGGRKLKI
eukprot:365984-Chlamydomonas_euryale.AAC.1